MFVSHKLAYLSKTGYLFTGLPLISLVYNINHVFIKSDVYHMGHFKCKQGKLDSLPLRRSTIFDINLHSFTIFKVTRFITEITSSLFCIRQILGRLPRLHDDKLLTLPPMYRCYCFTLPCGVPCLCIKPKLLSTNVFGAMAEGSGWGT